MTLDFTQLNKVLFLNDLHENIIDRDIDGRTITQLFTTAHILKQLAGKPIEIILNDRSDIPFAALWKPESIFKDQFTITKLPWSALHLQSFDLIICHWDLQEELAAYPHHLKYVFKPTVGKKNLIYPTIETEHLPLDIPAIRTLKSAIENDLTGFTLARQEDLYKELLQGISQRNKQLSQTPVKNMLILDDSRRKFYIGDSCFWLHRVKQILAITGDCETVRINCTNTAVRHKLASMFTGSFPSAVTFTSDTWDDIQLTAYDKIVIYADEIPKFLNFISHQHLPNTSIYHFTFLELGYKSTADRFGWSHNSLKATNFDYLIHERKGMYKEISISKEEINFADKWLENQGVQPDENIVILPGGASSDKKALSFPEFAKLVAWFTQQEKVKVLIFDENAAGKYQALEAAIGTTCMQKVIVAKALGLRKDMCLLASSYVTAIIGPCTGMMHAADGIYIHEKNHRLRENIPFLLVYTGNQRELDKGYHPMIWWMNSLVKCVILSSDLSLIKLSQCAVSRSAYDATTLPVSHLTAGLLTSYLMQQPLFHHLT